ncbi:hypothetical protein Tco_0070086, partial [Tanacetum coccineum]
DEKDCQRCYLEDDTNDVIQRMIFGPSSEMIWMVVNSVRFLCINIPR